jgi:hypothetical protein
MGMNSRQEQSFVCGRMFRLVLVYANSVGKAQTVSRGRRRFLLRF